MGIFLDLTGKKFGRLTVIGMADSIKRPMVKGWVYVCAYATVEIN